MQEHIAKILAEFKNQIELANAETGIRKELLAAMIFVESSGNPMAQAKTTSARGLMQITRGAAEDMGVPYELLFDPWENILCGAQYLKHLYKRNDNDERRAVMAYYAGHGTINDDRETDLDKDAREYADKVYACLA